MKRESALYIFFYLYGWAILSVIIAIAVLYFIAISPYQQRTSINFTCIAEKTCQEKGFQLNAYADYGDRNRLYCEKYVSENIYWVVELKISNYTKFKESYPECNLTK